MTKHDSVCGSPSRKNLKVASKEMAWAVCNVPTTMSGGIQFGKI